MAITKHTKLPAEVVTTAKIADNTIVNADIVSCAAITQSKISSLSTSLSNVCSAITSASNLNNTNNYNVALLGFKMAITESLTVFNLVDGIVDEFEDESGTDGSASTNLTYNSTDDYYINSTQPDGQSLSFSAGFSMTSVTEPDTSTTGTNPTQGSATMATYIVPTGATSVTIKSWGAAGGGATGNAYYPGNPTTWSGGGGGFSSGVLAVTPGQTLYVSAGEAGSVGPQPGAYNGGGAEGCINGGHATGEGGGGGGLSGVFSSDIFSLCGPQFSAPQAFIVSGSGGGGGACGNGGAAGGLIGDAGGQTTEQTGGGSSSNSSGGGGSQTTGGQAGSGSPISYSGAPGGLFNGGIAGNPTPSAGLGGGGSGYYGGGGGAYRIPGENLSLSGGGGSSFFGHPQITSGSTEEGQGSQGGGVSNPDYFSSTNEGIPQASGEDGYALIIATLSATATTSTIISDPFSASTVPTTTRMVVFEENIDTPTLNTDIIASVSRNGGTNFTTVTLTDSGYVTGSSGQRILTGTATISGQPSGQSMKWKLQLANQQVKIHGVSLSWA